MAGRHLHREGTIRIPSGCAIAAMMEGGLYPEELWPAG